MDKNKSLKEITTFMKIKKWFRNLFFRRVDNPIENPVLSVESKSNNLDFINSIKIEDYNKIIEELRNSETPLTLEEVNKLNSAYSKKIENVMNKIHESKMKLKMQNN